jgi:hypothetical protein
VKVTVFYGTDRQNGILKKEQPGKVPTGRIELKEQPLKYRQTRRL